MDDYDDVVADKQWAKKYILDPLHGPEPSQECGPGTSFRNPDGIHRSLSVQTKSPKQAKQGKHSPNRNKPLPSLPTSSSPIQTRSRPRLPASQPSCPAALSRSASRNLPDEDTEEDVQKLRQFLVRSQSVIEGRGASSSRAPRQYPPSASLNRSKTVHTAHPRETSWNQGTILTRQNSVTSTRTRPTTPKGQKSPGETSWSQGTILSRQNSVTSTRRPTTPKGYRGPASPKSIVASPLASPVDSPVASPIASPMASPVAMNMSSDKGKGLHRSSSLTARYPGDMSHRPLDIIKKEHKAAMRAPYLHNPRHKQPSDPIDVLDHSGPVGVPYHHDGPFDATMASRNTRKHYSPLEAVKDSNEEAIKATPREYIKDSLTKHVPLQGTAVVPPGLPDMSGRTMEYREGDDLMRERDAPGGAYKRYEGIHYLDDDLKGKGEPSFTVERERKEQKARLRRQHAGSSSQGCENDGQVYEMQPTTTRSSSSRKDHGARVRQRSVSNADERRPVAGPSEPLMRHDAYTRNTDLRRRNTTGNKFAEGLMRRFGSLRRKKNSEDSY